MAQYKDNTSKIQKAIDSVVSYLHENNQRAYATAVQNAAGRVLTYESGEMRVGNYNKKINRWLTESLFLMNSDPNCPPNVIKVTRKLIESYRDMNGMSTEDFTTDEGDLVVDVDPAISLGDALTDAGEDVGISEDEDLIIQNTEVGEEYDLSDIITFVKNTNVGVENRIFEENEVLDTLQHLVKLGYFEVTERDPFNGKISSLIRIR